MGGGIGVESTPGRGTRFWFEIPLAPATSPTVGRRALPEKLRGLRVLVLERDASIGSVVRTTGVLFSDVLDVLDESR